MKLKRANLEAGQGSPYGPWIIPAMLHDDNITRFNKMQISCSQEWSPCQ